jgi:tripeptidyl-peptidase-2
MESFAGKDWRAVVGGAEGEHEQNIANDEKHQPATLDLRQHRPMTDFRKEKHYERFGTQDLMSYSVNIVDDGEILRYGRTTIQTLTLI